MTGQRDNIEVLRDCLSILSTIQNGQVSLSGETSNALSHYVEETMEAILRPLYREGLE